MSWDLTVNGLRLNDLCRYRVLLGSSWSGMPGVNLSSVQLPGAHGVIPMLGGDTFQPAQFVINMQVWGVDWSGSVPEASSSYAQYDEAIRTIQHLFGNRHALLDIRRVMGDGSAIRADARATDGFAPTPQDNATITQFNVALELPGVFWEDVDAQTYTGTPGATSPHSETVATLTGGTAPVDDATLTVVGPCTNPRISQPDTGAWVSLTGSLAASDVWTVNCDKWTSMVGGTNVRTTTSYAGSGPRFLRLTPTTQTPGGAREVLLTLTGSGMGATTNLTVTAKRKFF